MDKIENAKKNAKLKRVLHDFPWLWAICNEWNPWNVEFQIRAATTHDLEQLIDFSDNRTQLWIRCRYIFGNDYTNETVVEITPFREKVVVAHLVYRHKKFHPSKVEYVILVINKLKNKGNLIIILRPPKGQKEF